MFGYAGLNTFSTSDDYPLRRALNGLGIYTVNRAIMEHGYTPLTYLLFAQKYTIDLFSPDSISANMTNEVPVRRAEYSLPIAYMVSPGINGYIAGSNPFLNQQELVRCMTGTEYTCFQFIAPSDMEIEYYGADYNDAGNHIIFFRSRPRLNESYIGFYQSRDNKHPLYACFTQTEATADTLSPYIAGKNSGFNETPQLSGGCIVQGGGDYGTDEGDVERVAVYFNQNTQNAFSCDKMLFARFLPEQISTIYSDLSEGAFTIENYSGNSITGHVTATETRPILFTSIPNDNGWHAYVDGSEYETATTMDDAFLALILSPGTHQITLKYIAPGSPLGCIISLISAAAFLLLLLFSLLQRKTRAAETKTRSM